jgi:hypothetical protein
MHKGKVAKKIARGEDKGTCTIAHDDGDSESVLLNEIECMLCVL